MSRAQALVLALRSGDIAILETTPEVFYQDVDPNAWYANAVARAVETKVLFPHQSRFFRPEQAISRAEFLRLLHRATRTPLKHYYTLTHSVGSDIATTDWFFPDFGYAKRYHLLLSDQQDRFFPGQPITRREAFNIIYQQRRVMFSTPAQRLGIELEGHINQLIAAIKQGYQTRAELKLKQINDLTSKLSRSQNSGDTLVFYSLSLGLEHLVQAIRSYQYGQRLATLENLLLAEKQMQQIQTHQSTLAPLSQELSRLIEQTIEQVSTQG